MFGHVSIWCVVEGQFKYSRKSENREVFEHPKMFTLFETLELELIGSSRTYRAKTLILNKSRFCILFAELPCSEF